MFKRLISSLIRKLELSLYGPKELTPAQARLKTYLHRFLIKGPEGVMFHNKGLCENIAIALGLEEHEVFQKYLDILVYRENIESSLFPINDRTTGMGKIEQFTESHIIFKYSGNQLALRKELAKMVIELIDEETN